MLAGLERPTHSQKNANGASPITWPFPPVDKQE